MRWIWSSLTLVAGILLLSAPPALAQATGELVSQPGVFSFTAPPGWKVVTSAMSAFPVVFAPAHDGFAANTNVIRESFPGTLAEYDEANRKSLTSPAVAGMLPGVQLGQDKPFETTAGIKGICLSYTFDGKSAAGPRKVSVTCYVFDGAPGQKLVVSCTRLLSDTISPALFETSLKTFSPR